MDLIVAIDWAAEQRRFMESAHPFAVRAARRAFKNWHERKRDDAEAEFVAKVWDQWARLLVRGKDPEPMLWPLLHWAKMWVRYDRKIGGRGRTPDVFDYRAGMTRHLLDGRGRPTPHDRAAPINGWLDWTGQARTDDPAELASALERAGMTLDEYLAA